MIANGILYYYNMVMYLQNIFPLSWHEVIFSNVLSSGFWNKHTDKPKIQGACQDMCLFKLGVLDMLEQSKNITFLNTTKKARPADASSSWRCRRFAAEVGMQNHVEASFLVDNADRRQCWYSRENELTD